MAGAYSEISILAPGSASAGSIVNVEARIKNLYSYAINLTATMGRVDGDVLRFGAIHKIVGAGQIESWYDSFIMPGKHVIVAAESWYRGVDNIWHSDDRAEKAIALSSPAKGTITRRELEHDSTRERIPVSGVPQGDRGLVHVWGRNDTAQTQRMGIYWFIADPDGLVVEEYSDWEAWPYTGAGSEHQFIGGRFSLNKVGKYTMWLELIMNPDQPEVVDRYIGELCTVVAELAPEFSRFVIADYSVVWR